MAVSRRAMRSVPVTSRKMMKMLMILSSDRSNQTIICVETEEDTKEAETPGQVSAELETPGDTLR